MIVVEWQERRISSVIREVPVLDLGGLIAAGIVLTVLMAMAVTGAWTWACVVAAGRAAPTDGAEAIVVLGAEAFPSRPSRELQSRLDHAAELWRQGAARRVICSGGWDGPVCEPLVMAHALIRAGVSRSAVEIDDRGTSTHETVAVAADYARVGTPRMLFVSSPYHLYRVSLEARRAGLDASVSAPASTPITRNRGPCIRQYAREVLAVWRIWVSARPGRRAAEARLAPLGDPALAGVQAWRG
jgi:uncharacterized SAM-binding protein YcdF (DUF218 family)